MKHLVYLNNVGVFLSVFKCMYPKALSLSLYGKRAIRLTSFVPHICTFSIAIICFLKTGDHNVDSYSRCSRTNDLSKAMKISLSKYEKV